ncbi:MAG TPA: aminotransferase class V-fold PLP-dependent enzyme [Arachidicoccus sp.]
MNRRELVKNFTLLNVGGIFLRASSGSLLSGVKNVNKGNDSQRDFFKELGVKRVINASVTMTFLSGSLMRPEVLEAINTTSHSFANMYELQDKAGAKIAEMLNCEAAMVTSGAACALLLGTAACVTKGDAKKIKMLPFWEGGQKEVIIQKSHRYAFDQAVRTTGVKLIEVEAPEQMASAINENTVMALYYNAAPKVPNTIAHEEFVAIAHQKNIPAFVDAAADVPPKSNLFRFQKIGFDLITFSGGKMIRGPQSAGLLFGRKDLIEAAKLNHSPYESPIGRPMKVNKEEIFGMYAALKAFLEIDEEKEFAMWRQRCNAIIQKLSIFKDLKFEIFTSKGPANAFPNLNITWDENQYKAKAEDIVASLKSGEPSIVTTSEKNILKVGVVLLQPEEVAIVSDRLTDAFKKVQA